jgi:hypothetical protein
MAAAPKKDDLKASFEAAAAAAKKTKKKPDNATLLKLYAFYKQATDGDVKGERRVASISSAANTTPKKLIDHPRRGDDPAHQARPDGRPHTAA